jgi:hypothetical protein
MELTQVYLEPAQQKALRAKARARGTRLAEEVRRAIVVDHAGVPPEQLELLDAGSRRAAHHRSERTHDLDRINARLDAAYALLSQRRAKDGGRRR